MKPIIYINGVEPGNVKQGLPPSPHKPQVCLIQVPIYIYPSFRLNVLLKRFIEYLAHVEVNYNMISNPADRGFQSETYYAQLFLVVGHSGKKDIFFRKCFRPLGQKPFKRPSWSPPNIMFLSGSGAILNRYFSP